MQTFLSILLIIMVISLPLSIVMASIFVNFKNYKYYRKIYKELPKKTFYKNFTQVYDSNKPRTEFTWFINSNEFCLSETKDIYLHNEFYTHLDLYSFYWLVKYQRWFEKNVNIDVIDKYTGEEI